MSVRVRGGGVGGVGRGDHKRVAVAIWSTSGTTDSVREFKVYYTEPSVCASPSQSLFSFTR